uniref:Uncharacterized protein n=1 Tax=Fagus sylvatica TaxID=28930 RepID=A0A2N9F1X2_FAGSY
MLKMSKDYRSAGLRWSLLLSGGSLGGHGSSLGFICSCFVFSITSPIMACVVADIFMKKSTVSEGASAMEDCAGLLGKTMNSALYWLLHLIDMLLAFVFSITSFISALVAVDVVVVDVVAVDVVAVDVVAVDVFVKVSTATAGQ